MRELNPNFEKELINGKFKKIIDYVKSQDDVFLGVRKNCIDLYVDGGCFFKLEYGPKKGYRASMDEKYYKTCPNRKPQKLCKLLKEKQLDDECFEEWFKLLPELKKIVKEYQEQKLPDIKKKREKILQQKLVHEFNKNSNYFAYDIEYAIEGATDWVKKANGEPYKNKKPKTEGRADILLISKPTIDNKISVYFMEVKEGIGAFSGTTDKEDEETFGSGIIGHLKNNTKIINLIRNNIPYTSEYRKEKFPKKTTIDIRETILSEIKNIMTFYKDSGLIQNDNFKNIDYKKLTLKEGEDAIKMVFFLGNYSDGCKSFENYLGINCNPDAEAKYSVRKLLDNKHARTLDLDYISYKDIINFKYIKTPKTCDDNDFELDIEGKYKEIRKKEFKDNK